MTAPAMPAAFGPLAPGGFAAPPPIAAPARATAAPEPAPDVQEALARHVLTRYLGMIVTVRAPTWREILFGASRRPVTISRPPPGALAAIDRDPPPAPPGDKSAARATSLLKGLRSSRPRGTQPPGYGAPRPAPPSRDAESTWLRRVWLTTVGPGAARLLVTAGYLTPTDVSTLQDCYPAALDVERKAAVEASMGLVAAGMRNGHEAHVPGWLNDQLLTLMAEHRPVDFFQGLYDGAPAADEPAGGVQGPSAGGPPSRLAAQNRPPASPESQ